MTLYSPDKSRYEEMEYRRCGESGIHLPLISLGLWQNFGGDDVFENAKAILLKGFDAGITHFDLANNYGPPPGSAEDNFGRIINGELKPYRDELIISTKAGYTMWPGPYGDWGSKKYLVSSLDQSLKRMGLDYVDIFYHHRPDPYTPLEETMDALAHIVRQGKALYVGISNYRAEGTKRAIEMLESMGTKCLIHQYKYSMLVRWTEEEDLHGLLAEKDVGGIAFSPLAQGQLTDRYLKGVPTDSRAAMNLFLKEKDINDSLVTKINSLNEMAKERGQSLAQMSLAWVARKPEVTSVLIGASRVEQLENNLGFLNEKEFSEEELTKIDSILAE